MVPNTRINSIEQIETALKTLTSQGYDTSAVWAEHAAWLDSLDRREPDDIDRKWAVQLPEPSSTEEHFPKTLDAQGNVVGAAPELLTAARTHIGRQYTLTPGQREVLRDRYGLTPTMTVIAVNVELFPSDDIIWSLTLKSTEHIDPRRRNVLNEVVLSPASHFFRDAAMKDKAREEEKETVAKEKADKPTVAKRNALADYI